MKKLKYWFGRKLREWLWPNWSYKGEMMNHQGSIVYMYHDKDYPEFEKKVVLQDRIDLTNRYTKPTYYLYSQHQLVYDHIVKSLMLKTQQQIELRFSAINRSGFPLNKDEIAELYEFINVFDWKPILDSMNIALAKDMMSKMPQHPPTKTQETIHEDSNQPKKD